MLPTILMLQEEKENKQNNMQDEKTYKEAYEELQQILHELENDKVDVDVLSEKLKRSSELIEYCKEKLSKIEVDVSQLIKDIEES